MLKKVIFDIDDTLWGLNAKISKHTGIPFEKFITFKLELNDLLSNEEKDLVLDWYSTTKLFENIEWFEGIHRINDLNADVYINSNVYAKEIESLKRNQIHEVLDIDDNHIILNTITNGSVGIKSIDSDVFIFVDDSPYNIANSKAKYNIMLHRPWNTSEYGQNIISDTSVIICDTLNDIIDTIEILLKKEAEYMSLEEILNNIMYDVTFSNGIKLHGTLEYVSQHFGDDLVVSNVLSKNQPKSIKDFCDSLFNYNNTNEVKLTITDFYNQIWTKQGE